MYLDPGSGSVLLQLILAGLLGAGVVVRVFWKKIRGLFGKGSIQTEETVEETQDHGRPQA
jgi:hypothetical protein